MRSILLYANQDPGTVSRVEAALAIAAAFNSHIHCLQVTPYDDYVVVDPFGGAYAVAELVADLREREAKNRAEIEGRLARAGASWTWISEAGDPRGTALDQMNLVDLAIVSIGTELEGARRAPAAARLATHTNTPILGIPPSGPPIHVGGEAMVAWNGSPESCRALCNAVPLLRIASNVTIVHVPENGQGRSAIEAAEYLGYHDIKAEIRERPRGGQEVHESLRQAAREIGAAYIVMGAYGRPRLQERIFGGVTLDFSLRSPCSLFMSH